MKETKRIKECYKNIIFKISSYFKNIKFIEEENYIAFSGNKENPELILEIYMEKRRKNYYLCALIDDEISYYEYDFKTQEEFENAIVKYIKPLVNNTVKYVEERKKHKYIKYSRYYKNNDKWILIDEDKIENTIIKLFVLKDSTKETIKEYNI